jgi:hypothetical protein
MLKARATTIIGLAITFGLQTSFGSPVSSQTSFTSPITTKQNQTCQSQRMLFLKASDGLLYPSESDSPFQYFSNHPTQSLPSPKQLASLIGQPGEKATQVNFDEFFNQVISNLHSSGAGAETIRRYQFLRQALKNRFTTLTVYRVGQIQVQIYITGVNSCGMAGLKTISIET